MCRFEQWKQQTLQRQSRIVEKAIRDLNRSQGRAIPWRSANACGQLLSWREVTLDHAKIARTQTTVRERRIKHIPQLCGRLSSASKTV